MWTHGSEVHVQKQMHHAHVLSCAPACKVSSLRSASGAPCCTLSCAPQSSCLLFCTGLTKTCRHRRLPSPLHSDCPLSHIKAALFSTFRLPSLLRSDCPGRLVLMLIPGPSPHALLCSLPATGHHLQRRPLLWLCDKAAQPIMAARAWARAAHRQRHLQHHHFHRPLCGLVQVMDTGRCQEPRTCCPRFLSIWCVSAALCTMKGYFAEGSLARCLGACVVQACVLYWACACPPACASARVCVRVCV